MRKLLKLNEWRIHAKFGVKVQADLFVLSQDRPFFVKKKSYQN
jgi:hypothetical protein